jgi:hypothetical protein
MLNDKIFLERKMTDLKTGKCGVIYDRLRDLKKRHVNDEAVDALGEYINKTSRYDGRELQKLCEAINKNNDEGMRFYYREFHREVFCRGTAMQHGCGFMQLRDREDHLEDKEIKLVIPSDEREILCKMSWGRFAESFANPEFKKRQYEFIASLNDKNKGSVDKEKMFKNLLKGSFSINSEHTDESVGDSKDPVQASAGLYSPTKMSIVDAGGEDKGATTIKLFSI